MQGSNADYQHTFEDVAGIAGAQGLGVVVTAAAALLYGASEGNAVVEYGRPLTIPFSGIGWYAAGAIALALSAALPGRYRRVWNDPLARPAIMIGFGQMFATAFVVALLGYILAGGVIDFVGRGQWVVNWFDYGILIAGILQAVVVLAAFGFLMFRRELPDIVD